jgi:hypothetical protein
VVCEVDRDAIFGHHQAGAARSEIGSQNVRFTEVFEFPALEDPCDCARAGHADHRAERRECCQRKASQQSLACDVGARQMAVGEFFLNLDTEDGLGHMGLPGSSGSSRQIYRGLGAGGANPKGQVQAQGLCVCQLWSA